MNVERRKRLQATVFSLRRICGQGLIKGALRKALAPTVKQITAIRDEEQAMVDNTPTKLRCDRTRRWDNNTKSINTALNYLMYAENSDNSNEVSDYIEEAISSLINAM